MDDYFMNSLFASDLLSYLFEMFGYSYGSCHVCAFGEDCPKSPFAEYIGKAVYTILVKNYEDFETCYLELKIGGFYDKETFSKCAVKAADSYFTEGYSPGAFLGYCAIVLGVSTYYYAYPSNGVPESAADVIALVLFAHQLTGQFYEHGGWDGLHKTSRLFNIACREACSGVSEKQNKS